MRRSGNLSHPPKGPHAGAAPCSQSKSAPATTRPNARAHAARPRGAPPCLSTPVVT